MDEIKARLTKCFEAVFPDLPVPQIPSATQETVPNWDSIAAITLVNVIEEEFSIQMDLDELADLDSFERIAGYLQTALQAA